MVDVLIILVFAFCSLVAVGLVAGFIAHSMTRFHGLKWTELGEKASILVPAQTVAYLLLIGFMVQLVRFKNQSSFGEAISWRTPGKDRVLGAIATGVGLALASGLFESLFSRWVPKSLPIDKYFSDTHTAYLLAVFGVAVAPLVEELFFRGFLYPALARPLGIQVSVVLTAAGFAVVHQGQLAHAWVPLTWLFIVGAVLTVVRARTKSVATCVIIHVTYNLTLFALFFIASHGFNQLQST